MLEVFHNVRFLAYSFGEQQENSSNSFIQKITPDYLNCTRLKTMARPWGSCDVNCNHSGLRSFLVLLLIAALCYNKGPGLFGIGNNSASEKWCWIFWNSAGRNSCSDLHHQTSIMGATPPGWMSKARALVYTHMWIHTIQMQSCLAQPIEQLSLIEYSAAIYSPMWSAQGSAWWSNL